MKLLIKNKLGSFTGSSFVLDEKGEKIYEVKGKLPILSPTHKKRIMDMEGNILYTVRNKFFKFIKHTCFVYDENGEKILEITEKLFNFKHDYFVHGYKDDYSFEGKFIQFPNIKLDVLKNGKKIGYLSKDWNLVRDQYTLDVESEEDKALLVALVIAIDNVFDSKNKSE